MKLERKAINKNLHFVTFLTWTYRYSYNVVTQRLPVSAQAGGAAEHHTVRVDSEGWRKTQLDARPSAFHLTYFRQNRTSTTDVIMWARMSFPGDKYHIDSSCNTSV